jgi:thousand and one amino acid protein kinase
MLQKQMIATMPKERHREVLRQTKEEQMRKIAMLALQYERTIADMAQKQTVKIDETQLKEQEALRRQLQQEQDMLQAFQEAQDEKLRVQHERERTALQEKVELSKRELDKEIFERVQSCRTSDWRGSKPCRRNTSGS